MSIAPLTFLDAVEHLNKVTALLLMERPQHLSATTDATLFLLRAHRERGTQIRQSIYDYALKLEATTQ